MRSIASYCMIATLACAALPQSSDAQTRASRQLEAVLKCRQIAETSARLSCFDRTAGELEAAQVAGKVSVVDREAARAQGVRSFGLSAARAQKSTEENLATPVEVKSIVRSVDASAASPGRWNLTLANGMSWQSVEVPRRVPRIGDAVSIKRVRLGGFRASVGDKQSTFLVKRLR